MQMIKKVANISIVIVMVFLIGLVSVSAQVEDTRNSVFICLADAENPQLIEVRSTESNAFLFAENVAVEVYSSPNHPVVADVIHIEPDTTTGTYRYNGDVVRGARTTSNILPQSDCTEQFADNLVELERTILLPISPDQALAIRSADAPIPSYDDSESSLFIGAIGLVFRDNDENNFPHFQILRFSGGSNDTISIAFPTFTEDEDMYAVSRQVVEHTYTYISDNIPSQPTFLENRPLFLRLLNVNGDDLTTDILAEGDFRFHVNYGKEITYRIDTYLNFSRLSSFVPREFEAGSIINPLYCDREVSYFRADDYTQHVYFTNPLPTVSRIACGDETVVEIVLPNGILEVADGFYIASWLVDIVGE